jgi:manganese transport protein
LLLLWFQGFGIRTIEAFVLALITTMAICFGIEILWAKPAITEMAAGLVPHLDRTSLYLCVTILGATVMPHNMYLHSALVQTRKVGHTEAEKRTACKFNLIDSVVALNGALLVNAAILVMAGALFFKRGIVVQEIQQAHLLLEPLLGTGMAGVLFAVALLCSGQSSTLTGTLAGQIVMEGFLNFRMRPWLRRLVTRAIAVVPAALTIYIAGDKSTLPLLLLSQAIISMQLPFAIVPLIQFTSDRRRMGVFANRIWVVVLSWITAAVIIGLNMMLAAQSIEGWIGDSGRWRPLVTVVSVSVGLGLFGLLVWIVFEPLLTRRRLGQAVVLPETAGAEGGAAPSYSRILVPLDHTDLDRLAIHHAAAMAKLYGATVFLLHVEEGVTSQIYGKESSTAEVEAGEAYLARIAQSLQDQGITVKTAISHSSSPKREILRHAKEVQPDLVIMGAHGHGGIKDLVFGNTINPVRHNLAVPMLIVRPGKT